MSLLKVLHAELTPSTLSCSSESGKGKISTQNYLSFFAFIEEFTMHLVLSKKLFRILKIDELKVVAGGIGVSSVSVSQLTDDPTNIGQTSGVGYRKSIGQSSGVGDCNIGQSDSVGSWKKIGGSSGVGT